MERIKYNIFGWSQWSDVKTFTFIGDGYLLQGRKHRNGKTRFRCAKIGGIHRATPCMPNELDAAGLWKQIENA